MSDFDIGKIASSNSGLDAFLGDNPDLVSPAVASAGQGKKRSEARKPVREDWKAAKKKASGRIKVSSLAQLTGFVRCAEDALIHRSDRELWSLRKDGHGEFYIERMFDESGAPLKG